MGQYALHANLEPYTCRARPARLGGDECGYHNDHGGLRLPTGPDDDLIVCEDCGCTRRASELREQEWET